MVRVCEVCANPLPEGSRPERKYCKTSCKNKAQYWRDPEKARERNRTLSREEPERRHRYSRTQYETLKAAGAHLDWKHDNPEKVRASNKAYVDRHREALNARRRQLRKEKKEDGQKDAQ